MRLDATLALSLVLFASAPPARAEKPLFKESPRKESRTDTPLLVAGSIIGGLGLATLFASGLTWTVAAAEASRMATSLDPWSELVACEGQLRGMLGSDPWELPDPSDPARQKLCFMARARPPVQ